jgi:hypothetical protein
VDKRTVYGSICGSKNDRICLTQCWDDPQGYCPGGCKEYVLADPVKYAKLEAQAARVTELEAAILQKEEVSKIHPDGIRELVKLAKYWEDRTFDTEVKLEAVERERDSLKQQLAKTLLSSLSETYALVPLKVCRAAKEALHGVIGLVDESRGVIGWHLSGNEAPWSEFNYPEELDRVVEQLNKCLPEEEAE